MRTFVNRRWRGLPLGVASVVATGAVGLTACGHEEPEVLAEGTSVTETLDGPEVVDWVVFDEVSSGLLEAERHLIEAESHDIAATLNMLATRFETIAEAASGEDSRRLTASAIELRALARDFPEDLVKHRQVLGDVEGRAFVALARHHLLAAERMLANRDAPESGRHLLTAARDISEGFRASAVEMPASTRQTLDGARAEAERWLDGVAPTPEAAGSLRRSVRREADRLEHALGARGK